MKRFFFWFLCLVAAFCAISVFLIGGQTAAYAWNLAVFIFAPVAVAAFHVEIVLLALALFKRRSIVSKLLFMAVTLVLALPITVLLGISPVTYPARSLPAEAVTMSIPVENTVLFGGKSYKTHAMWPSERYAYDLLKEPYNVDSNRLEDFGIYLADVYAPVAGTVMDTLDTEENILPNTEDFKSSLGNYIFMEIEATGTYLILAHLEKGSIAVSPGDYVTEGTVVAKVGNSGTTSEPHLHIQHQKNNPMKLMFPTCAVGLPLEFKLN